jgi:plastocyanin
LFVLATGCGGSDDGEHSTPDAPAGDASTSVDASTGDARIGTAAMVVPCNGATIADDVWYYVGFMTPGSPVSPGSVIRFHDLGSHTADHVAGLWSANGDTETCVQFDGLGEYAFNCYFHPQETGKITVVY